MAQTHARHERMMYGNVRLYAGTACPDLAQYISDYLKAPLQERDIVLFPNDNIVGKERYASDMVKVGMSNKYAFYLHL